MKIRIVVYVYFELYFTLKSCYILNHLGDGLA